MNKSPVEAAVLRRQSHPIIANLPTYQVVVVVVTPRSRVLDSRSASIHFPHLLRNPKLSYHVYKNLLRVPILSQLNPIQTSKTIFCIISISLFIQRLGLPTGLLHSGFQPKYFFRIFHRPMHATYSANLILPYLIIFMVFSGE
jgi:hypothetical protein